MTPERWTQVGVLYHAALKHPPEERQAFLNTMCGDDADLRREVESLLAAQQEAPTFMSAGALEDAAKTLVKAESLSLVGKALNHYQIISLLGSGGMGEVYLAEDDRLKRKVAIKVLPVVFTQDLKRVRRFEREARTASALNHPNIITIYEVGEAEGLRFIVTEFIEGKTLRERMKDAPMELPVVVDVATQVAAALGAAHAAGIVHRDLKPENIMVRPDGVVKVLDFGLAKLVEPQVSEASTRGSMTTEARTATGVILGTFSYMSPEQACGREADARSDVFSFGVVLYEMLCGRQPFRGATDLETLQQTIHASAPPLSQELPQALRTAVEKALEKDPSERYQSMRDLVADLRSLGGTGTEAMVTLWQPRAAVWRKSAVVVSISTVLLVIAAIVWSRLQQPATKPSVEYTQITNFSGSVVAPALSPDGRMVAFIRGDNWFLTPDQIYVKLLPNGEPIQITHDPRAKYSVSFSHDGSLIAYTTAQPSGWDTYTVSPLGRQPSLFLSNAAGLSWLDEHHLLFSEVSKPPHMGIVTATENRLEYRKIYFPEDERGMAHFSYASPDRKWALVVEMNPTWQPCRLVPLDGSSSGRLVGPKGNCYSAAWSPDGKWMYFGVETEANHHLWRQRFPVGEPEQITFGPTEEDGIAVAPDGKSLITSIGTSQSVVWIHDHRGERPVFSEGTTLANLPFIPAFSSDGRVLFYLRRQSPGAAVELWRTDVESGRSDNVVSGFSIDEYDISSDGKEALFSTRPSGKPSQIWLVPLDRSSPPKLVSSSGENSPHFGPNREILFRLTEGNTHYLARMNRDGSDPAKVVPYPIGNVESISPDRRWVVALAPLPDGTSASVAVPVAGGAPRLICPGGCPAFWAPDGKFLYVTVRFEGLMNSGKTLAIPVPAGETLPKLPDSGITIGKADTLPGWRVIDRSSISPGPDPSMYAYVKTTVHRNLFRIPLDDR
jgi:serine/threonine protein kinase